MTILRAIPTDPPARCKIAKCLDTAGCEMPAYSVGNRHRLLAAAGQPLEDGAAGWIGQSCKKLTFAMGVKPEN
jgi:hypothetical protein